MIPSLGLITFGFWEILLVLGIVMVLFGAKKLPLLARGLGAGIRNFKGELSDPEDGDD
ncbi:MAG: Sec-independent protein translocase subunit TatA/TatB [Longimicrobiales bacterium]